MKGDIMNDLIQRFLKIKIDKNSFSDINMMYPALLADIILNHNFIAKNSHLVPLVKALTNNDYKPYLFKSRTLLYSRVVKDMYINSPKDKKLSILVDTQSTLREYIKKSSLEEEFLMPKNDKKKSEAELSAISQWKKIIEGN